MNTHCAIKTSQTKMKKTTVRGRLPAAVPRLSGLRCALGLAHTHNGRGIIIENTPDEAMVPGMMVLVSPKGIKISPDET